MQKFPIPATYPEGPSEPVWDIARLFPPQGAWSEQEYLDLETNHLVEFSHGHIEVLPMPSDRHQSIVGALFTLLLSFARQTGGKLLFAPIRLQLWPGKIREPDLLFLADQHDGRRHDTLWLGADLVVEVISPDDPSRDLVTKRGEYAQADIPEYWIVDPINEDVLVLSLKAGIYVEHGRFGRGAAVTSSRFSGLEVAVDAIFDAN